MSKNDCLPEPSGEQFYALLDDIRARGVQLAVEVCAKTLEILDGRARGRACKQLKIRHYPRRVVSGLNDEEDRRHHRLRANCLRRQLDRAVLKQLVLEEMRRKAQSDRALAAIFGVSHPTIGALRSEFEATGKLLPVKEFKSTNGNTFSRPTSMYATTAAA